MKRRITSLLCLAVALASPGLRGDEKPAASASETPNTFQGTLRWINGDTIPGELTGATAAGPGWKTALFDAPMQLKWTALSRLDQPLAPKAGPDGCGITLRDGSYLLGELTGISADAVTIHSTRHGDAVLKRSEVASIRRLRGKSLVWAGPAGAASWEADASRNTTKKNKTPPAVVAPLAGAANGELLLPYFNRGASLNLDMPDLVDVEFHLRASARPDFQFVIVGDPKKDVLRVETWDNQLVLAAGDQFCPIGKVVDDAKTLALRVCWNRKDGTCTVFNLAGERQAEWKVPEDRSKDHAGVVLQNKGRDLALEFLRVRTWDGKPPAVADPGQPRVELADGRVLAVKTVDAGDGTLRLQTPDAAAPQEFPLGEVDAIYLSPQPAAPAGGQRPILTFADGTWLSQEIDSIKDGTASLKTSFADAPFLTRLDGLAQLRIHPVAGGTERPPDEADKLTVDQTSLRGHLVCNGGAAPLWLPAGGLEPVPIAAKASSIEITRGIPPDAQITPAPALFYTSTGDVLPGQIHAVDRTGVEFESGIITATKLPAEAIEAIQFGTAVQGKIHGFADPSWQIVKGDEKTIKREGDSLKMDPDTTLGNPIALQGSELSFTASRGNYYSVRLRLFCAGLDPKGAPSLMLMVSGGTVYSGLETGENQMDERAQTSVGSGPINVRLAISETAVALFINGSPAQQLELPASKRPGGGLIIEPASAFGNETGEISLAKFDATLTPGQMSIGYINPEARSQALTVPRFLKDDLPRQALVARNGDVLRGEIEAVTKTHLGFRAGLENLNIPLDRVEAAIWLKKPAPPDSPDAAAKPAATKFLDKLMTRRVRLQNVTLGNVITFLKQAAPDLVIKPPEGENPACGKLELGGTPYAKVVEQICTAFGLSYRLEADDSVVLKSGTAEKNEVVRKMYRLNTKPFSDGQSVQDALAGKGINFPPGATASWEESTHVLTMANTGENQRKLAGLIDGEWGGTVAQPTHWLTLVNGGRLGLKVDRFDADAVVGRHAMYGACRVPLQDIALIRTSALPPSSAVKSLRDWQLVLAPEPVLPEAGGEGSPLVGKEAKVFRVPLLDGGEFDLGAEKGKVVVLDFWATWCGPCVQSMPGTMAAVSTFPADKVRLVAMNQSEPEAQVKRFLTVRGWKLAVGMDAGAKVGHDYGADAIPHMVIVGPDGKVAWVKTGFTSDGETEVTNAIRKLLDPQPPPQPVTTAAR